MKFSGNVTEKHLCNISNNDICHDRYSENAKFASVRPFFKKDDQTKIKNYRPVTLLHIFSKITE